MGYTSRQSEGPHGQRMGWQAVVEACFPDGRPPHVHSFPSLAIRRDLFQAITVQLLLSDPVICNQEE